MVLVVGVHPVGLLVCVREVPLTRRSSSRSIIAYNHKFEVVWSTTGDGSMRPIEEVAITHDDPDIQIEYLQGRTWYYPYVDYIPTISDTKYVFVVPDPTSCSVYSIPVGLDTLFELVTCRTFKNKIILWMQAVYAYVPRDVRVLIARECCELYRLLDYDDYTMVAV